MRTSRPLSEVKEGPREADSKGPYRLSEPPVPLQVDGLGLRDGMGLVWGRCPPSGMGRGSRVSSGVALDSFPDPGLLEKLAPP